MKSKEIQTLDAQYILPTYARYAPTLIKGSGCVAETPEGKAYLDFTSGIGTNSLGFCDKEWADAVAKQAATLQHTSNLFYTQPAAELAAALCKRTGMAKVFFCNSGAEANEGAIKAARKYSLDHRGQNRSTIITLTSSFHGRTLATLAATGQESMHQYFHPFPEGFKNVQAGDLDALEAALTPDVCAVMLEPVQGEGGVIELDPTYLKNLQQLCHENGVLVIADEVQTGMGRCGTLLASASVGLAPDIVTLAKGLGGGLPIGAVLFSPKCATALGKGDHGSTYGGNPVCCAAASVVLARITDSLLEAVRHKGGLLRAGLRGMPGVDAVNGRGLMVGISFKNGLTAAEVQAAAMQKGLLCLTAKHKLRLLPPLTITEAQIHEGLAILQTTLEELA